MNPSKILAVCKFSKFEYDKLKFNLSTSELNRKYKQENIQTDIIMDSHIEQKKCKTLAKKLFQGVEFINTPELTKDLTKDKELIISIGGDEHFKYVIHNSVKGKLVLNVRSDNLKSEGALTTCNRYNLKEMVEQIHNKSYLIQNWVRLDAELNGKSLESAIDTIFIGEKNGTRMSRYFLNYRNKVEEQKSSGLLIVTGAGSTGWFQSAGGVPFSRNAEIGKFLAREIYVGTKTGSTLKRGEFTHNEEVIVKSLSGEDGIVEIDSIKEYPFKRGESLKVFVSKEYLNVMIFNPEYS